MEPIRAIQTDFAAGEIAPSMLGRTELQRWYSAAELLRNLVVVPQGGVRRRPGMRHLHNLIGNPAHRLIPFAFNVEQTYAFLLLASEFVVYRADGTQVAVVGGCPWTATQAEQMNFAQSADTLLLFHAGMPPQRIRRGASDSIWTRDAIPFVNTPDVEYGGGPEPIMSSTRGWPECGAFHQQRLWIGGFASRPATILASKVGDVFNLALGSTAADDGILFTLATDNINGVFQMATGRTLEIFTAGAEHALVTQGAVTPPNVDIRQQTPRGIQRYTAPARMDGASLFVQRGGGALRGFLFDDAEAAYKADIVSLLAPHLIRAPAQIAARIGAVGEDADNVILANPDGEATLLTTLRAQNITAFSRWATEGRIRGVCALASGEVFFTVERFGNLRVELWDQSRFLDASVLTTSATPFATLTGLSHLEGRQVHLMLDESYQGTHTVSGGAITLPRPARRAEAGLLHTPEILALPVEPRAASGSLVGRKARITRLTARVRNTGLFEMQGRDVIFRTLGGPPAPPLDSPPPRVTGDVRIEGIVGWRQRPQVTIRQPVPGPFELLALSYDLRLGT